MWFGDYVIAEQVCLHVDKGLGGGESHLTRDTADCC